MVAGAWLRPGGRVALALILQWIPSMMTIKASADKLSNLSLVLWSLNGEAWSKGFPMANGANLSPSGAVEVSIGTLADQLDPEDLTELSGREMNAAAALRDSLRAFTLGISPGSLAWSDEFDETLGPWIDNIEA